MIEQRKKRKEKAKEKDFLSQMRDVVVKRGGIVRKHSRKKEPRRVKRKTKREDELIFGTKDATQRIWTKVLALDSTQESTSGRKGKKKKT